jgi:hypothetical protein
MTPTVSNSLTRSALPVVLRRLLQLHVVGEPLVQDAARPALSELPKREAVRKLLLDATGNNPFHGCEHRFEIPALAFCRW